MTPYVRLDRLLGSLGYGTRSELRSIIRSDRVTVNGGVTRDFAMDVIPSRDIITFDGEIVITAPAPIVMMNKPTGVLTAHGDKHHSTVMDLLPAKWAARRMMPVGRLDLNTTGLLLFTDDGDLAHRLIHPKHHVNKVYKATIDVPISDKDIAAFQRGMTIGTYRALPAGLDRHPSDPMVVFVTLREGKYHQVKLMLAARSKHVLELERVSIGPIRLDPTLKPGGCRALSCKETAALREAVYGDQGNGDTSGGTNITHDESDGTAIAADR